jgi:hypothetical protein
MRKRKKAKVVKRKAPGTGATVVVTPPARPETPELYVLQTPDGGTLSVRTTASSSSSMDQSVARFAEAMKRLAKR